MSQEAEIFQRNAKTFSYAGKFFDRETRRRVETLYSFFRWVDDLAERDDSQGRALLQSIEHNWDSSALDPQWIKARDLFAELQVDQQIVEAFFSCMRSDSQSVRIRTERELLRYCYGAASTVGLCLVSAFGVKDQRAYPFAIDLGIAMQLTNIVRDVVEDRANDKIYLPELTDHDLESMTDDELKRIKAKYVDLADKYYASAEKGFVYLPARARFCVSLAATLYRQIGIRALRAEFLKSRAYTHQLEKAARLALHCVPFGCSFFDLKKPKLHDVELHRDLQGLPYVHKSL